MFFWLRASCQLLLHSRSPLPPVPFLFLLSPILCVSSTSLSLSVSSSVIPSNTHPRPHLLPHIHPPHYSPRIPQQLITHLFIAHQTTNNSSCKGLINLHLKPSGAHDRFPSRLFITYHLSL
ncbi:hypothetical protein BDN71DRAFT_242397 [Pleurotus eryngii]|uniref:Secreted protein n=1 Tax=Pleurotus eryngii TaxID=5323 RepID=A0A9P5ZMC4_PLEER|nr:hypothetical protein BDN71DRAFT_242397 [Pleurotus eryngii]